MVRPVLAVIAGYLVFAIPSVALFVVTGRQAHEAAPAWFMIVATAWGMAAAIAGGYVAAAMTARFYVLPQAILAVVIAGAAVASLSSAPEGSARWSPIAAIVFIAPSALLGGWLWLRRTGIGPHPAA